MYMYLSIQETHLVVVASDLPAVNKTSFLQRATWESCQVYAEQLRNRFYAQKKTKEHLFVIEVVIEVLNILRLKENKRTSMCD